MRTFLIALGLLACARAFIYTQYYYASDTPFLVGSGGSLGYPLDGISDTAWITRATPSSWSLAYSGPYLFLYDAVLDGPGQLAIAVNGVVQAKSVIGRNQGGTQMFGVNIIAINATNTEISIVNPSTSAITVSGGYVGRLTIVAGFSDDFAEFWMYGGINARTIPFTNDGPSSGGIARLSPSAFQLANAGDYLVLYQASVIGPDAHYCVELGAGFAPAGCAGRNVSNAQIFHATIVSSPVDGQVLALSSPDYSAPFIPYETGGSAPVAAVLVILELIADFALLYTPVPPWGPFALNASTNIPYVTGFGTASITLANFSAEVTYTGDYLVFGRVDPSEPRPWGTAINNVVSNSTIVRGDMPGGANIGVSLVHAPANSAISEETLAPFALYSDTSMTIVRVG